VIGYSRSTHIPCRWWFPNFRKTLIKSGKDKFEFSHNRCLCLRKFKVHNFFVSPSRARFLHVVIGVGVVRGLVRLQDVAWSSIPLRLCDTTSDKKEWFGTCLCGGGARAWAIGRWMVCFVNERTRRVWFVTHGMDTHCCSSLVMELVLRAQRCEHACEGNHLPFRHGLDVNTLAILCRL